ncbi:MAG: hypothetical protein MK101_03370 [Phycisphaerales bacterium]|nr:hypothetical protein [Phycisphaerales bacterium]
MRRFWTRWGSGKGKQTRCAPVASPSALPNSSSGVGREIRIGLDLGVATTGCVVNLMGPVPSQDECIALQLDAGSPSVATTIAVEGDMMRIGAAAESSHEALRSVLMWLPMLSGDQVDTSISHKYGDLRHTVFKFGDHMISAKEVVILFLERVLGRVLSALDLHLGRGRWHGVLRVAAPAAASRRYREMLEEIVSLALDLAIAAGGREPSMTESLSGLTERYQRGNGRTGSDQCGVSIVSSAEVAATALASKTSTKSRRVVAVDVGAGSTSVTCFTQSSDTVTLNSVKGVWGGMDDIDQLFASGRAVRQKHPRVFRSETPLRSSDRPLVRRGLDLICSPLPSAMQALAQTDGGLGTWRSGRRAAFDLVLMGGGARCEMVKGEFARRERSPMPGSINFWDVTCVICSRTNEAWPCGGNLPRTAQPLTQEARHQLVQAEGLAARGLSLIAGHRPRRARSTLEVRTAEHDPGSRPSEAAATAAQRARDASHDVHG